MFDGAGGRGGDGRTAAGGRSRRRWSGRPWCQEAAGRPTGRVVVQGRADAAATEPSRGRGDGHAREAQGGEGETRVA
jgi:hypothetical protein